LNRAAGLNLNVPVVRAVFLGFAKIMAPDLLSESRFKCSSSFIRNFLANKLHWSWRTPTRAAQKTPDNWESKCEDAFLRIVYQVMLEKIVPEAVINSDQLGVHLIPVAKKTWAPSGAKQVPSFGKEEKRQFTLMVTTTASGDILPFQCIYKGKTKKSLPSESKRHDAEKEGFLFSCGGETHWSNLECVKEVSKFDTFYMLYADLYLILSGLIKSLCRILRSYMLRRVQTVLWAS
jgi:hypothetical protein